MTQLQSGSKLPPGAEHQSLPGQQHRRALLRPWNREAREERLRSAVFAAMTESRANPVGPSDIARHAQVSKALIYKHFGSGGCDASAFTCYAAGVGTGAASAWHRTPAKTICAIRATR
ncbi:TetR/AcrR family transcriptional regulator [Parvibaculum sp.]|uniref:TetR/AcrR family transcriptional regulator n=2 Tax=Parvibaculum sp. TaxID=2024848 RepID=UPI00341973A6